MSQIEFEAGSGQEAAIDWSRLTPKSRRRVARMSLSVGEVWVKRPVHKIGPLHRLQRVLAALTGQEMFRPTASAGGGEALRLEAAKIETFRAAGLRAPRVLYVSDERLVITDIGRSLARIFNDDGEAALIAILDQAAGALGRAHSAGLVHGRPSMRDLVWDGHEIGFLDFEERPETVMSLAAAKARDLWLFLIQAERFGGIAGLDRAFAGYAPFLDAEVEAALARFLTTLSPITRVTRRMIRRFGSHDANSGLSATEFLIDRLPKAA
jgi:hypothetical protein